MMTKHMNEDGRGRCLDCNRRVPYEESRLDHLSWIRLANQRFWPVCRHLPWARFLAAVTKCSPGWTVEKVALKAPSHHYLRVIKAVHALQHPQPQPTNDLWPAGEPHQLTPRSQLCATCGATYDPHICGLGWLRGKVTHFPVYPDEERPPHDTAGQ